jgi:hypothetical protein
MQVDFALIDFAPIDFAPVNFLTTALNPLSALPSQFSRLMRR